jgi:hypothetical protein
MKTILLSILIIVGFNSCTAVKNKTDNIKFQKSCADVTEQKTLADIFCKK